MRRNLAGEWMARALTGPIAFFAGGVVELAVYLVASLARRARLAAGGPSSPPVPAGRSGRSSTIRAR